MLSDGGEEGMGDQLDLLLRSVAPNEAQMDLLRREFPEAFIHGKVDPGRLLELLGGASDLSTTERFGLDWSGREEARSALRTSARGCLIPDRSASVDFDSAENLVLEGDNLEVLKLLLPAYEETVKMVFIDPPYNTGHDFLYNDDFRDGLGAYLTQTAQVAADGTRLSSRVELDGRQHSRWLTMMYPRLVLARRMLRSDGVLFVTIDDHEVHHLRMLLNEIFGEENFVAQIAWQKRYTRSNNTDNFTSVIDQVLLYQRSDAFQVNLLPRTDRDLVEFKNPDDDPRGPWKPTSFLNQVPPDRRPNLCYPITNPVTGDVTHNDRKAWRTTREGFERLMAEGRLWWGKDGKRPIPQVKTYLSEIRQGLTPTNFWSHQYAGHTDLAHTELKKLFGRKVFDTPKPSLLVRRMLEHATGPGDLVMDFFAGSGTTAQAVLEANAEDGGHRRYILVQLPEALDGAGDYENIADITRDRARRVASRLDETTGAPDAAGRGYRAFRLTRSPLPRWDDVSDRAALERQLASWAAQPEIEGDGEALAFELLLRAGHGLTASVEAVTLAARSVVSVSGGTLLICLDRTLDDSFFDAVVASGAARVICREAAFVGDDALRVRAVTSLRDQGVDLRTV